MRSSIVTQAMVAAFFFCLPSQMFSQSMYYVSPAGSDSNAGTEFQPWRTVQKACNSATPGSIVNIKAGTYNEKVTMNVSGTAIGGFITFQNYGSDTAIIDGTGQTGDQLILIQNKNYIKIVGLELRNNLNQTFGTGIWVQGFGDHIELRNNRIHDMRAASGGGDAMGISIYGSHATIPISHLIVDGNQIFNCEPGHSEALTLNGNVDTFQISNNIVHDVDNIGIDMIGGEGTCPTPSLDAARNGRCEGNMVYRARSNYGGGYAAGIYVDGGRNITVERNNVHECDIGLEIGCEIHGKIASGMVVRDNLIYNNDKGGIGFGGYNYPTTGQVTTSSFLNNTCYSNDVLNTGQGELNIQYALNCVVKNNIFHTTTQNRLMTTTVGNSAGNALDYNLWFTPGGVNNASVDFNGTVYSSFIAYQNGTGQDANSLFAGPQFVSSTLSNPDLHLQVSSPARNAGDPSFVPDIGETDYDGNPRLTGGRVDIGAIEQVISVPGPPSSPQGLIATRGDAFAYLQWRKNPEVDVEGYRIYGGITPNLSSLIDSTNSMSDTNTTISGLINETCYYFRLTAFDVDGNESGYSNEVTVIPTPFTQPPSIPILVEALGDSSVVVLRWRKTSGAVAYHFQLSKSYDFNLIEAEDSTIIDTTAAASSLPESTLYYWRVRGKNSLGVSDWSSVWTFFTNSGTFVMNVSDRWNLISVPLSEIDYSKSILFPTAASNAFAYEGSYVEKETLANGVGYWLKFYGTQTIRMNGVAISSDTLDLVAGWNLFGSISSVIGTNTITSDPPGRILSQFFEYAGSFVPADSLRPGKGYWVKMEGNAKIILSASPGLSR